MDIRATVQDEDNDTNNTTNNRPIDKIIMRIMMVIMVELTITKRTIILKTWDVHAVLEI